MIPSGDGATARAPAWKRLGLKLKQSSTPESANETLQVGHPSSSSSSSRTQQKQSTPYKRKPEAPPAGEPLSALKKSRSESHPVVSNPQLRKKKSVSFDETPSKGGPADKPQPKKAKVPGKKQANSNSSAPADIKPALDYLNQWNSARGSWKFNKNHQSTLIKYAFDPSLFPSANIDTFYTYIRDLKGFVRTRLQETAMGFRIKDSTEGAAGFPEGSVNLAEKQLRYDQLLAQLLHAQAGHKRKTFHEAEYRASSQDVDDVTRRVIKRMRAEMVLDQLSDGEETDASHTTTTTTSSATASIADSNTTKTTEDDKKAKLNEGPSKRRRKLRTNVEDSSSSSESESDSETSSSGSSSDDSDSEGDGDKEVDRGYESSSSSSSSSSSPEEAGEEESDTDDESVDEE
ncbi:proteasome subunit alpha type 6 [Trichoderma cornu-damae]|uniref:Proteasome subunit alpha type 6 n=1 Tax=Trichoderma cornu-damae TaxID=654480 RepID=A0A9P8QR42_9HYPO|nr:proteasome subunit alpha type 6 [Trichoderma cornu-damae]